MAEQLQVMSPSSLYHLSSTRLSRWAWSAFLKAGRFVLPEHCNNKSIVLMAREDHVKVLFTKLLCGFSPWVSCETLYFSTSQHGGTHASWGWGSLQLSQLQHRNLFWRRSVSQGGCHIGVLQPSRSECFGLSWICVAPAHAVWWVGHCVLQGGVFCSLGETGKDYKPATSMVLLSVQLISPPFRCFRHMLLYLSMSLCSYCCL